VLKDDWESGLRLLTEILTHPRFEPQIFDIAKMQEITGLKRQGGDA
jgi:predicted Zn-dependent peptidase